MKILVAEDDPRLLKTLIHLFESNNFIVDGVSDGEDALEPSQPAGESSDYTFNLGQARELLLSTVIAGANVPVSMKNVEMVSVLGGTQLVQPDGDATVEGEHADDDADGED